MKLKDFKGFPKKKELEIDDRRADRIDKEGRSQALSEISEIELVVDEEKIREIIKVHQPVLNNPVTVVYYTIAKSIADNIQQIAKVKK